MRISAAGGLCQLGNGTAALTVLIQALSEDNVALKAAELLGQLDDRSAVLPLLDALASTNSFSLREAAVKSLGMLGDSRAVESLIATAEDNEESVDVRKEAIISVAKLKDPRVPEMLLNMLETKPWSVVTPLAEALAQIGAPHMVDMLTRIQNAVEDEIHSVRQRDTRFVFYGDGGLQDMEDRKKALQATIRRLRRLPSGSSREQPREEQPLPSVGLTNAPVGAEEGTFEVPPISPASFPLLQLTISALSGLKVDEYNVLNFRVSNAGRGLAGGLSISVNGPWESSAPPIGEIGPGVTKTVSVHVMPTRSGPEVPIIFQIEYVDTDGISQHLEHRDSLPVSSKEEAKTPVPPTNIYVQQQQAGEAIIGARQTSESPVQTQGSPAAQPVVQICPKCGEKLDLARPPRFCPGCGERLQEA